MSSKHHLEVADYAVVLMSLIISSLIGIGFRFTGNRQKTTNEYLLAGKNSRMLPVVMSTSVTTISGIAILSIPAEVYRFGGHYLVVGITLVVGMFFSSRVFVPVYFGCGVSSIYEYLEMRFGKYTRYTVSTMFMIEMILYMAVVLFAPVLALSAVTEFSVEMAILLCGSVCTFYCFLGGLKAVLWADVFQSILMFSCLGAVLSVGIYEIGGIGDIYRRAIVGKRLDNFNIELDFASRYTLLNCLIRGLFFGLGFYGVNQIEIQRILSMSGLKRAQTALQWSIIPVSGINIIVCIIGLILYSVFYKCDPILMKEETGISKYDQLLPYFIITRLKSIPGLTGLCIAGIFSGSLSTMSSALNSLTTVAVVDFIQPSFNTRLTDAKLVFIAKGLSLLFGIICIVLTFAVSKFDSLVQVASVVLSVVEGPVIAIFLIGMLTKKVSDKSAVVGLFISLIIVIWIGYGTMFSGYIPPNLPLETSACSTFPNSTFMEYNSTPRISQNENRNVMILYKMSFAWITPFGCVFTLFAVFLVSLIIDRNKDMIPSDSKCLSPVTRFWMKKEKTATDSNKCRNKYVDENQF